MYLTHKKINLTPLWVLTILGIILAIPGFVMSIVALTKSDKDTIVTTTTATFTTGFLHASTNATASLSITSNIVTIQFDAWSSTCNPSGYYPTLLGNGVIPDEFRPVNSSSGSFTVSPYFSLMSDMNGNGVIADGRAFVQADGTILMYGDIANLTRSWNGVGCNFYPFVMTYLKNYA